MSAKHTPGPWTHKGNSWQYTTVYDANNRAVCLLDLEDWGVTEDNQADLERQQEEVARLIAAAPELLIALSGLLDDIEDLIGESEGVFGLHLNGDVAPWIELEEGGRFERLSHVSWARAAIAKAKGEAK